jgi:hypothetical protein
LGLKDDNGKPDVPGYPCFSYRPLPKPSGMGRERTLLCDGNFKSQLFPDV